MSKVTFNLANSHILTIRVEVVLHHHKEAINFKNQKS